MNSAVYIGAGVDAIPIILCSTINEFIYIDSQPFSEFRTIVYDEITNTRNAHTKKEDRHVNAFSRDEFTSRFHTIMSQIHFELIETTNDYWLFENNNRSVSIIIVAHFLNI